MRGFAVLVGFVLPACDLVIPIDELPPEVRVAYEIREVRNGADGMPVTAVVEDRRLFDVALADGTVPALVTREDGSLSFVRPDEGDVWRFSVQLPDDSFVEYQLATPRLMVVEPIVGRHDRQPASTATVTQQVPNAPASSTSYLVTTGLWTETPHDAGNEGSTNTSFVIPWNVARSQFGATGQVLSSAGDRAYATSMAPRQTPLGAAYFALTHACENTFNMLGVFLPATLSCDLAPVAPDRCTRLRTAFGSELDRVAATLPPIEHPSKFYGWFVGALPAAELRPDVDLALASRFARVATSAPAAETADDITYGNPYPGHAVGLVAVASLERELAVGGAQPMIVDTRTRHWIAPATTCETVEEVPSLVAIPHAITLDGTPLDQDDRVIATGAQLLQITWSDSATGAADLYRVMLHEVGAFFNVTLRGTRRTYVVTDRRVLVDPALLQPGRTYMIEIEAHVGVAGARAGDFRSLALPYAIGSGWSATFHVQ